MFACVQSGLIFYICTLKRLSPTALDAIRCLVADADAEAEASPPLVPFDSYEYSIVGTLIATNLYVQLKSLSDT